MMMALHIWSMSHGVASLFARGDAARRKLPMSADELLEAEVLIYLRGLGFPTDRRPPEAEARSRGKAPVPGASRNKIPKIIWRARPAVRLTKIAGWDSYVNVIYIHNGVMP